MLQNAYVFPRYTNDKYPQSLIAFQSRDFVLPSPTSRASRHQNSPTDIMPHQMAVSPVRLLRAPACRIRALEVSENPGPYIDLDIVVRRIVEGA